MATVNFTGKSQGSGTMPTSYEKYAVGGGIPYGIQSKLGIIHSRVDTSKTGITNTNADVYEALYIPAGTLVITAWMVVNTGETTNTTAQAQFGITGTDTDEYVAAAVCATDGEVKGPDGDIIGLGGTLFETADTLDILVSVAAFTDAIFDCYALVLDLNP